MEYYRTKQFIDFTTCETYYGFECKLKGQWYVAMEHGELIVFETEADADSMCEILNASGKGPVVQELPNLKAI